MKRFLVRLSVLTGVVVLGLMAIAQAQRIMQPATDDSIAPADARSAAPAMENPFRGTSEGGAASGSVPAVRGAAMPEESAPPGLFTAAPDARPLASNVASPHAAGPTGSLEVGAAIEAVESTLPRYEPAAYEVVPATPSGATAAAAADHAWAGEYTAEGDAREARPPIDQLAYAEGQPTPARRPRSVAPDRYPDEPRDTEPRGGVPRAGGYDEQPFERDDRSPRPIDGGYNAPTYNGGDYSDASYGDASYSDDDYRSAAPRGGAPLSADAPAAATGADPLSAARRVPTPDAAALGDASSAIGPAAGIEGTGRPGARDLEGPQTPALTIEKLAPEELQVGRAATIEIVVRNVGQVPAQGVEIHDVVPRGLRLVGTKPRAAVGPTGEIAWSVGTLRPGEEARVALEVLPLAEGEVGSVAHVVLRADAAARSVVTQPLVQLDVTAPAQVLIGEELTFHLRLTNRGTGAALGLVIEDQLPAQLEHAAGSQIEYEVGDLAPGASREIDLTVRAVRPGPLTNHVVARSGEQVLAESRAAVEILAPALEVAVEGPKRRYLERQAVYTLSISNPGTAPAHDVELVTHLPAGFQFVEADQFGHYDPQTRTVHWRLEQLPPREIGTVTLTALPLEAGEHRLRVETSADDGLESATEQTIIVEGVAAILFEVVDVDDPVEVGGEATYEIRVTNQGTKTASNLQIAALLSDDLRPLAAAGPTRHILDGQRVLFDALDRLAPKEEITFRVRAQALRAGDARIRVQLVTDEINKPITKEESTRVYADQ